MLTGQGAAEHSVATLKAMIMVMPEVPEEGLLEYAKLATKLRRQFTEKAEAARVRLAALLADGE